MPPLHTVSTKTGSVKSLNAQSPSSIYPYGFPITLNLTMGYSFGCEHSTCFTFLTSSVRKNMHLHAKNAALTVAIFS